MINPASIRGRDSRQRSRFRRSLRQQGIEDPWFAVPAHAFIGANPHDRPVTSSDEELAAPAVRRGRSVARGLASSSSSSMPRAAPKGKAFAQRSRVRWGNQWGTMTRSGWQMIDLNALTPKMRLKSAFCKVLHLIRLRKMWSQIGALLQLGGRNSYFPRVKELLWTVVSVVTLGCIRPRHRAYTTMQNGGTPWTLAQAWGYLGVIVRRAAPMFKHLERYHGHLCHKSIVRERMFRSIVLRQIHNNGWWNWTPEAHRSIAILDQPI